MTNIMKSTALIAALSLGTAATAEGTFGFQTIEDDDSSIITQLQKFGQTQNFLKRFGDRGVDEFDLVRTSSAGVLAIYDYSTGEFGELLGTADLNAGANADVNVTLDPNNANQLAAVIYEGEIQTPAMASGWMELDISDDS